MILLRPVVAAGLSLFGLTLWQGSSANDVFRITLLGTGNPRPSIERFGPAILVEAGTRRVLIDAGRGVTMRLFQIGQERVLANLDAVLLTHLHSDHLVGLPDLWLTGWIFGRVRPLAVYGPAGTHAMMHKLEEAFEFDIRHRRFDARGIETRAVDIVPGVVYEESALRISAFAVEHGDIEPAFGYRVEFHGRVAVFSGDTRFTDKVIAAGHGADVLVHEVLSVEKELSATRISDPKQVARVIEMHTTPEDAGRIFGRVKPRLAVYSHIVPSPATEADLVGPTRKTYTGPLVVGHDLMMITIGDRIDVADRVPLPDK
jgi:ribonuclease Z